MELMQLLVVLVLNTNEHTNVVELAGVSKPVIR